MKNFHKATEWGNAAKVNAAIKNDQPSTGYRLIKPPNCLKSAVPVILIIIPISKNNASFTNMSCNV